MAMLMPMLWPSSFSGAAVTTSRLCGHNSPQGQDDILECLHSINIRHVGCLKPEFRFVGELESAAT